ncbi:putative ABC transporter ATP-binding protein YxlF [bacterium BMS3Abin07]|nr:putative ABC transporter ATP-binding protein YxlF [bacterium BMS3Abin07]GBE32440.1 putative ABC transporter ATP-binding protein YxlF [bacterium BMS3Bbin05]HDL20134.1 ATP-binding cassette domain-containing protein [Nitrospirota bacterium]HDO23225.1 ATP-binding cassette domain-containing protein [Nitrospirota bacterium]HDZ87770.1 ATP-binding cassette domain-containing protein [Nitrospirota bacterium]
MIRIENLTKYYGDVCAVDDISLDINEGEILGLLGPNGAGKTTTLRILTCYMTPTSGNIHVKDLNIHNNSLEIKKFIGYLPESAPLYPDMIVYDYLCFVADIRQLNGGHRESRIRELAGLCGLNEVMHKSIHELSKGYKQRVGLAHAMMSDPEILVLDEPTSGLDPNQIVEIREIIKGIGKEKTVILSTHILTEAEAACDRVVIINHGRIVADGTTDELKKDAGSDYIVHISLQHTDFDIIRDAFRLIPGVKEPIQTGSRDGIIDFYISCSTGKDVRPDIYSVIRDNGWPLLEFHMETRTLENIFRELTRES